MTTYTDKQPITKLIPPKKQSAKRNWGNHPYFTRRAWNVVQEYIRHFSKRGDVVLDPFGGTGVTAVEALVVNRPAIHVDINPMANYICDQIAVSPVRLSDFESAFNTIEKRCKKEINEVFELDDPDSAEIEVDYWYPKDVPLPKNADAEKVEDLFTRRQLFSLSFLLHEINKIDDEVIRELLRFAFSATLNKTNLTFSSTKGRKASRGNSGIMHRYRYWIPPEPDELNVWEQFAQKFDNIYKLKQETNKYVGDFYEGNLTIYERSATQLSDFIEEESIDYIFTDPPYGAHIAYLDLSTMWNAWLGFPVDDESKDLEVIEGGDLNKSKDSYIELLKESIVEMFEVLKFDRWMSIVFAHKDPAYWDAIIKSAEDAGFEYSNTVTQPAYMTSLHKRQNPLKVLSGEMIINFKKVKNPKTIVISKIGTDVIQLIKEVAELTIVLNSGASTDQIYERLIPKLLENGLLGKVKKELEDITPILADEFEYSKADEKWRIAPNKKLGSFIPLEERIKFYVVDYLQSVTRDGEKATFDDIVLNVMPNLINGKTPSDQTILSVLEKIAESSDGEYWILKKETEEQIELDWSSSVRATGNLPQLNFPDDPNEIEHDSLIYVLAKLAHSANISPYIGKRERDTSSWNNESFKDISVKFLPDTEAYGDWETTKIEQIDLIWYDESEEPLFAFEIETTTPITTGIDRFYELLNQFPEMAKQIVLVIPPKREKKLTAILKDSHYIGHPMYLENKLVYCFTNDIVHVYQDAVNRGLTPSELLSDIRGVLKSPKIS